MTSKRISSTLGSVADSFESAWNRLVIGVRARHMPKSIKKVKKTLQGNRLSNNGESYQAPEVRENDMHQEAISFYPKYMGSTLVEELIDPEPGANYHNTGLSTKALDRIVRMTRSNKLIAVSLNISSRGVEVIKLSDRTFILDVPMNRIAFCSHDKKYSKVCSFICKNTVNDTLECHAFLCDRQKMAKVVASSLTKICRGTKDVDGEADNSNSMSEQEEIISNHLSENDDTEDYNKSNKAERIEPQSTKSADLLGDFDSTNDEPRRHVVVMRKKSSLRRQDKPIVVDDDFLPPITRGRADSDSWAVMVGGAGSHDSTNVDLELEFSNFARSRSQANLADLHTSVHSGWDI